MLAWLQSFLAANPITVAVTLGIAAFVAMKRKVTAVLKRRDSLGVGRFYVSALNPRNKQDTIVTLMVSFRPGHPGPTFDAVRDTFMKCYVPYLHYHSVPTQKTDGGPVTWEPCEVDPHKHFLRHSVDDSKPGAFEDAFNVIFNTSLDKTRPWWSIHYLQSLDGKTSKVIMRTHHAIGDAASMVRLWGETFTDSTGAPLPLSDFLPGSSAKQPPPTPPLIKRLALSVLFWLDVVRNIGSVVYNAFGPCDTPTPFYEGPKHHKMLRETDMKWFTLFLPGHRLDYVKAIKNALSKKTGKHVTVNEIEYAIFAGAMRRYLSHIGVPVDKILFRCVIPLPMPHPPPITEANKYEKMLNNWHVPIPFPFPLRLSSAYDRIMECHEAWRYTKESARCYVFANGAYLNSFFPIDGQRKNLYTVCCRQSVAFSGVAGPPRQVYLAGAPIESVYAGHISIMQEVFEVSMNGKVFPSFSMMDIESNRTQLAPLFPRFYEEELKEVGKLCDVPCGEIY